MADSITYTDNDSGRTAEVTTSQKVTVSWTGAASSYTLKYATGGSAVYTQVYQGADTSASFYLPTNAASVSWLLTGDGATLDTPLTVTATLASETPEPTVEEAKSYLDKDGLTYLWGKIKAKIDAMVDYPVGYVYMSANANFNPNGNFTGTWELINGFYLRTGTAMSDSGSNTHAMTVSEMPAHTHDVTETNFSEYSIRYSVWGSRTGSGTATRTQTTSSTGSGQAFSIEPSSYNIKAWRRTQ